VELGLGDRFERIELEHARVVDEHVEAAERLLRLLEQPPDVGRLRDVPLDGERLAAPALLDALFTTSAGPAAPSALAIPAPIAFDAPVTTATLPCNWLISILLSSRPFDD
jgi:hypothetical protein